MKQKKIKPLFFLLLFTSIVLSQKSAIYTYPLREYKHAVDLYNNRDFVAAKHLFNKLKDSFDNSSENKANCIYYEAFCAIELGEPDGDQMMMDFVDYYPTSLKHNRASIDVGDYYFKNGNYPYALKWYNRVESRNLSVGQEEDFTFKYAYSLFAVRSFTRAKEYFQQLLNSPEYGAQAKYYYGFIAYQDDDYDNANRYLSEVANNKELGEDVPYYMANIKFKTGEFQEAIDIAKPFLAKADRNERSELSKIIGESYFNLEKYSDAIPFLLEYKGKRNRWNNTDYYLLGYAYYKQKDYENAIANFNKIIGGNDAVAQNAYYHLAECYLNSELKTEALNAFRNAAQMDYDPAIKKDAWLNYAKLSYEIGNPYKSVPDVLKEYLELYPKTEAKEEIENLLISAYVTSKDYQGALDAIKDYKDDKNKQLYQKMALYRGIQLFNEGNLQEAKEKFNLALENPHDNTTSARAEFWKSEVDYQNGNYADALNGFKKFETMPHSDTIAENKEIYYNLGYTYFKLKQYDEAATKFEQYINSKPNDEAKLDDSTVRMGDSYYAASNYNKALTAYNKVIADDGTGADYAFYQRAMSEGFLGRSTKKIELFNEFLQTYQKSSLRDDAYFELGNAYMQKGHNANALETFANLLQYHKSSSYVPKALLRQGLIYYNTGQDAKSIEKYQQVVRQFPNTSEAKEAVANARQVYIDLGRVDEYADWVKTLEFIEVSDAELEKDMYASAEKQYLENNYKKATTAFDKYIHQFPRGPHAVQAHFYMAEALYAEGQKAEAIKHYEYLSEQERNEYSEQVLTRLAQINLDSQFWKKAIPILERLESMADHAQNIIFAQSNLMKGHYELQQYDQAVTYAEKVLAHSKLDNKVRSDAKVIIARAAFKTGDEYKAQEAYEELLKTATGELKAEALYYDAYFKHKEGNYKVSNTVVQTLVSDYSAYKYYGAKGLIIMAKNFYEMKDAFQATYILESVIKNFSEFKDVTDEAKQELQRIKTEEAKTNESVNPDN